MGKNQVVFARDVASALQDAMERDEHSHIHWVAVAGEVSYEAPKIEWPTSTDKMAITVMTGISEGTILKVVQECEKVQSDEVPKLKPILTIKLLCGMKRVMHDMLSVQRFLDEFDYEKALNGEFPTGKVDLATHAA